MIFKAIYGFNTFAGLRVGEIQQKIDMLAWRHIPSKENNESAMDGPVVI